MVLDGAGEPGVPAGEATNHFPAKPWPIVSPAFVSPEK
ncbi:MAG: hypothetical protein QOC97_218, partial [Chloroflexota bacterium]|nr:hypothetical protein [Chloroflexota bacterium]